MNIFKKTYQKLRVILRADKARKQIFHNQFDDYKKYLQDMLDIDCIVNGHQWVSDFSPKKEIAKPVTKRVYCKHCGVYYHEHAYYKKKFNQ